MWPLSLSPQTLLPSSFLTGEKQEVLFIRPDQGHTQGNIRALPFLGLGRGSKIRDMLLVRMRGKARLQKINSQLVLDIVPRVT